ncbi:MAG: SDR family NAD(P)-dependent oxidoreductase [Pseudomonadota bacterium]
MTVVITGTSRGIGKGLADAYRARGEEVIATTRDSTWAFDVCDTVSRAAFAEKIGNRPVDLLVCNAGVYLDRDASMGDGYEADVWTMSFAVNVTGVYLTVETLMDNLRAADAGRIAIISSRMGSSKRALGGSYIYRASKAAALNLGRNLSRDLAVEGIAVGIYHPGWVRTDMGGPRADISTYESVTGLMARFDALDLDNTGSFLNWDGREIPY